MGGSRDTRFIEQLAELPPAVCKTFISGGGIVSSETDKYYLANLLIHDLSKDILEETHDLYMKYANIICDDYLSQLTAHLSLDSCHLSQNSPNIYIPKNDPNFLFWTLITLACSYKLNFIDEKNKLKKHYVKRNDGSAYTLFATLENTFDLNYNPNLYNTSGIHTLTFNGFQKCSVRACNTFYDNRIHDCYRILKRKFVYLYCYIIGKITKEQITSFPYNGLLEHALLIPRYDIPSYLTNDYETNMIVTTLTLDDLLNTLPPIPKHFSSLNYELGNKLFKISKSQYPEHKQGLCRAFYQNALASPDILTRVLQISLKNGLLKPLSECQKKTVNMIMFSDVLPIP